MFSENHKKTGCIEVVCGSMFSGKTEELIRRLRRAQFANQTIAIFKPAVDKRYSEVEVVSHDFHKITSTPISVAFSTNHSKRSMFLVGHTAILSL